MELSHQIGQKGSLLLFHLPDHVMAALFRHGAGSRKICPLLPFPFPGVQKFLKMRIWQMQPRIPASSPKITARYRT